MPIFFDDNGTRRKYTTLVQQIHGNGVSAVPQPMLPLLTGNILSTFPVAMEPGKSYTGKVSGVTSNIGTVKYKILPISSAVALVFSKTENISAEELFTISVLNNATENSKVSFLIEANTSTPASNGPMTLPIGISIFKNNTTPDATSVIWNISQTNFEESKTIEFSISGGTDPENDGLTYQLSTENNRVSFNKTTNISSTDKVTMNVGAYPDTTEKVFISVVNSKGVVSTNKKTYTLNITAKPLSNTPPNASTIVWTGLSQYQEEGTYTVAFSGGSDAETTTGMTYEITNILPVNGISFSKTVGITQNESITLTTPTVSADTAVSFELKCRDASDALSTNSVTLNLTVKNKITANQAPSSSTITSNFPSSINENTSTNTFTISGGSDPEGSALTYRIVIDKPTVLTFSKTTGIVANEAITITAANINSDTSVTLSIYAVDALGTESTSAKTFTTTVKYSNIAPNMTNFTTSLLGSSVNEGTNNQVIFSGASDPEGQQITYEITSIPPELTFGKTTGITDGEIISVSVSNVTTTKSVTFAVYAKDSTGAMSETKNVTVTINDSNNSPNSTNIIWTGGTTINESSSKTVSFSGATDPDGDTITYEISNISNSVLSFSKTAGITTADLVTITASSVNSNTTITFDVKARDSKNAVSTAKSFSITVNNVNSAPSTTGLNWNGPSSINENTSQSVYFYGAVDAEGDNISYSISNISGPISFSKSSFSAGESITMSAGAVTSTTSVSFMVTVTDSNGASNSKTFSVSVTDVPVAPKITSVKLLNNASEEIKGLSNGFAYYGIIGKITLDSSGNNGVEISFYNGASYVTLTQNNIFMDSDSIYFTINKIFVPDSVQDDQIILSFKPYVIINGNRTYGTTAHLGINVTSRKEYFYEAAHFDLNGTYNPSKEPLRIFRSSTTGLVGDISVLPKNTWITISDTMNWTWGYHLLRITGSAKIRVTNTYFGINEILEGTENNYSKAVAFAGFGTKIEFYYWGSGTLNIGTTNTSTGKSGYECYWSFN